MAKKNDLKAGLCRLIYLFPFGTVTAVFLLVYSFYNLLTSGFHLGDLSFLPEWMRSDLMSTFGIIGSIRITEYLLQIAIYLSIIYLMHLIPRDKLSSLPVDIKLLRLLTLLAAALIQAVVWFYHGVTLSPVGFDMRLFTGFFLPLNLGVIALLLVLLAVRLVRCLIRRCHGSKIAH